MDLVSFFDEMPGWAGLKRQGDATFSSGASHELDGCQDQA
jgi:hypothetical protein